MGSVETNSSYGERASDNLAKWLGLGHLSGFDTVLVITLLPVVAIVISWWLPWEKWLFERLARMIAGPYFLYCALVLWHLQAPWWAVVAATIFGAILSALAVRDRSTSGARDLM